MIAILLALLCTAPLMAAQKTPLQTYISKNFYKQKIMDSAREYALLQDNCAKRSAVLSRIRYDIIAQPVFKPGKMHPVAGAWYETVSVGQCLNAHMLHITIIADRYGNMPQFIVKTANESDE